MTRKRVSLRMAVAATVIVGLMIGGTLAANIDIVHNGRTDDALMEGKWETVKFIHSPDDIIKEETWIRNALEDKGIIDGSGPDGPVLELLHHLSDLERRYQFVNVYPYYYWYGYGGWDAIYDHSYRLFLTAPAAEADSGDADGGGKGGLTSPTVNAPEVPGPVDEDREIEEADIVKLVGDTMYVLNPYRGLQIIDLSRPDDPVILGRAALIGSPVDLYVVDDRAIVITSATMQFWSQYMRADYNALRGEDDVSFRLGSEIAIVDISDPMEPRVTMELGVDGFVTDSRRVGDVLYFVSSVSSFYGHVDSEEDDHTSVMSVNLADPMNAVLVDELTFSGSSNHIHVTEDRIYITQTERSQENWWQVWTSITIVDISDPEGDVVLCDDFTVYGEVEERYQLDHYDDTFRIITHYRESGSTWSAREVSKLYILDVSNANDIRPMSSLEIGDPGDLMATRFAGDRAYTIHLPRNQVDPLDVMDLSDPYRPKLCCVLEIPGWVDHLAVRGYQILAIGVNQVRGQQVAITLFDVTDPYNAVVQDREVLEGDTSWSNANWDPRSITIVDEEGLLLLPYSNRNHTRYSRDSSNGVYVVSFDLDRGELDLAGTYEHTGSVTRTRMLGQRAISTSVKFLEVADLSDPYAPRVTATLELCPYVIDAMVTGDYIAEMLLNHADDGVTLRVMPNGYREGQLPYATLDLEARPFRWLWNGDVLYLFDQDHWDTGQYVTITTVDLSDLMRPEVVDKYSFTVKGYDHGDATRSIWYDQWFPYSSYDFYRYGYQYDYYYYYPSSSHENLILLDEGLLVYENSGYLYALDLTRADEPRVVSVTSIGDEFRSGIHHMMASGRTVMVTQSEYPEMDTQGFRVTPIRYLMKRIDMTDPYKPVRQTTLNVPGVPVGVDSTGRNLFTTGYWLFEDGTIVRTLNVARLGYRNCVLMSAYDITGFDSVSVEGDMAVITEWDDDATLFVLLDLMGGDGIERVDHLLQKGDLTSPYLEGGHMFVTARDEAGIMVYSLMGCTIDKLGFYRHDRTIESIQVVDDCAYVVQGMYGLSKLRLA